MKSGGMPFLLGDDLQTQLGNMQASNRISQAAKGKQNPFRKDGKSPLTGDKSGKNGPKTTEHPPPFLLSFFRIPGKQSSF